jgi:hypothetical protein
MRPLVILIAVSLVVSGCIKQIAVTTVGDIILDGFDALTEEQDLAFAAEALPANLKLMDVLIKNEPENRQLLMLACEGYSSYSLGFIEDQDPARARAFYLRARDYGLRVMRQRAAFARGLDGSVDDLKEALMSAGKSDVPALFWTAFAWGAYINVALTSPQAIAELPKAQLIMERVAELDSTFYHGGPDLFLGTLYGSRPKLLGGDTTRARQHFEKALRINGGKFLMTYIYYARAYAVQTMDEVMFDELLARVDETPLEVLPRFRLPNAIAKQKAKLLRERKEDWF